MSRDLAVKTPSCHQEQIGDESLARAGCKYYDSEQGEVGRSRSKSVVIWLREHLPQSFFVWKLSAKQYNAIISQLSMFLYLEREQSNAMGLLTYAGSYIFRNK